MDGNGTWGDVKGHYISLKHILIISVVVVVAVIMGMMLDIQIRRHSSRYVLKRVDWCVC